MTTGIAVKLKGLARLIGPLVAIELFLPGGTLIVLGSLRALRCHVPAPAGGERAVTTWRGFRGLRSANTGDGGSSRADDNTSRPTFSRTGS
jgi:hypothetical protein